MVIWTYTNLLWQLKRKFYVVFLPMKKKAQRRKEKRKTKQTNLCITSRIRKTKIITTNSIFVKSMVNRFLGISWILIQRVAHFHLWIMQNKLHCKKIKTADYLLSSSIKQNSPKIKINISNRLIFAFTLIWSLDMFGSFTKSKKSMILDWHRCSNVWNS